MADKLTDHDRDEIGSVQFAGRKRRMGGAEMRMEGLLKPVYQTAWGVWALTKKGSAAASGLPD